MEGIYWMQSCLNSCMMRDIVQSWTCQPVDKHRNDLLLSQFKGERNGYIEVGPEKYLFPARFATEGINYSQFKPRSNDTWIVTFPRSGTTLTQELVWILKNNLDYNTAAKVSLLERVPFLEFSTCMNPDFVSELLEKATNETTYQNIITATKDIIPDLENSNKPRIIKTHIPISLLNPDLLNCGAKVIYVGRNPKDVLISYYHLHRFFKSLDFVGTFEQFWEHFQNNQLLWCPYWSHLEEAWKLRHNSNILFLFYEEIQQNMVKSIQRISSFLNVDISSEEAHELSRHLDISNFHKNPSVNVESLKDLGIINPQSSQRFIRHGGSSRTSKPDMTIDMELQIDAWIKKHLSMTSLRFPE